MFPKKINKLSKKTNILVVPLDWGLGHATRCIPIIKALKSLDCNVIIAAEFSLKSLLSLEFHDLTFISVPGYRVKYSKDKKWLPLKILTQVPGILYTVVREHFWLKKIQKKYFIRAVIADNRFGLFNSSVPCVYITHQLKVITGNRFTGKIAQKIHYWFIKKYSICWVPDYEGSLSIAGALSHPQKLPPNTAYIGCLSRFEKKPKALPAQGLLVIISGPEPQRTIFEQLLLRQLQHHRGSVLLVRGLPGSTKELAHSLAENIIVKNHLAATELNDAIEAAEWVISRSGYTTIMDLLKLSKKAILVPTPGQTEQEYLADHLVQQQFFFSAKQETFNLNDALQKAAAFPFIAPSFDMELYRKILGQFVQSL